MQQQKTVLACFPISFAVKNDGPALFKKYIFIDYAITVVPFPPFIPFHPAHLLPLTFPTPYSSFPWVILISSLASMFPILFLISPCLFCTCHLCFLFLVPFPPILPPPPSPSSSGKWHSIVFFVDISSAGLQAIDMQRIFHCLSAMPRRVHHGE